MKASESGVSRSNIFATRKKEKEDKRRAGIAPWAATALGAGALGTAYGLASDSEMENAIQAFRKFEKPLGPNDTLLTRYAESMSPSANLKPFGVPVSELMPKIRAQGWLMGNEPLAPAGGEGGMWQGLASYLGEDNPVTGFLRKGLGHVGYETDTLEKYHGARGHYGAFAKGPVAAYAHFLRDGHRNKLKLPFDQFIRDRTAGALFPDEIDTAYMSVPKQTKLLQDFHESLSPELQAFKVQQETGNMGEMFRKNTDNYRPIVENVNKGRNKLKDLGIVAGSSGLGGLAGHSLYRALTKDDEESNLGASLSTAAGMGLGGLGAYYYGTSKGRDQLNKLMSMGKTSIGGLLERLSTEKKAANFSCSEIEMLAKQAAAMHHVYSEKRAFMSLARAGLKAGLPIARRAVSSLIKPVTRSVLPLAKQPLMGPGVRPATSLLGRSSKSLLKSPASVAYSSLPNKFQKPIQRAIGAGLIGSSGYGAYQGARSYGGNLAESVASQLGVTDPQILQEINNRAKSRTFPILYKSLAPSTIGGDHSRLANALKSAVGDLAYYNLKPQTFLPTDPVTLSSAVKEMPVMTAIRSVMPKASDYTSAYLGNVPPRRILGSAVEIGRSLVSPEVSPLASDLKHIFSPAIPNVFKSQ